MLTRKVGDQVGTPKMKHGGKMKTNLAIQKREAGKAVNQQVDSLDTAGGYGHALVVSMVERCLKAPTLQ